MIMFHDESSNITTPLSVFTTIDSKTSNITTLLSVSTTIENKTQFVRRARLESVVVIILLSAVVPLSVIGNTLVCGVICSVRKLRKHSNILIVNLAIVDIGFTIFVIPFSLTVLVNDGWIFSHGVCIWNATFLMVFNMANILTLTGIAVSRFTQICHPDAYRRYVTRGVVMSTVCSIWIISLLLSTSPLIFGQANYSFRYARTFCLWDWPTNIPLVVVFVIVGLIPYVTMTVVYLVIIRTVVRSRRRVTDRSEQDKITWFRVSLADVQLSKISLVIYIVFLLCWLPGSVADVAEMFHYDMNIHYQTISSLLLHFSPLMDPVIYAFMNGPFRLELRALFKKLRTETRFNARSRSTELSQL